MFLVQPSFSPWQCISGWPCPLLVPSCCAARPLINWHICIHLPHLPSALLSSCATMLFLLVLLSAALGSSASALASRASPVPISYYTPPYLCPSGSDYQDYIDINYPPSSILYCLNGMTYPSGKCFFSLTDGTLMPSYYGDFSDPSCNGISAIPGQQQPCGFRCPSLAPDGTALGRATAQDDEFSCLYSAWCNYNLDGTLQPQPDYDDRDDMGGSDNSNSCPPTVVDTCVANRRRFRGEDNLTALLRKRNMLAAAKPAPS
ncbi:hypothetical protein C8R45DRAFT_325013 [Mycena sanguinolenta]|nr:hypothetical protein C8R45DRAFT_325013 [Mycena sanguinolenta]